MSRDQRIPLRRSGWITLAVCALIFVFARSAWTVTYEYDELNRLKKVNYENGAAIVYECDAAGNITAVQHLGFSNLPAKLLPSADTFVGSGTIKTRQPDGIFKSERDLNFGRYDALIVLRGIYLGKQFTNWRGALIRFDLSQVPPDVPIRKVELRLFQTTPWPLERVGVYRMLKPWEEMEATGSRPSNSSAEWWEGWEKGSRSPNHVDQATAVTAVQGPGKYMVWDVTAEARRLVRGELPNFGWYLKSAIEKYSNTLWISLRSREWKKEEERPCLLIEYGIDD
jgi:hypothetical protein